MFQVKSALVLYIVLTTCGFDHAVSKYVQPHNQLRSEQLISAKNIVIPGKICLTEICNNTASEILKNMDDTVDPCDDFYQFACGGWIKSTIIPDGFNNIGIFHQKNEILMNQLEMSLNETIKEDEPRPLKMVKAYFKSCMDESEIEKNSVNSLLQIIKSVGGWPLIEGDKWNETNFDWIKCLYKLQKMGYFIDNMPQVYVDRSMKNKTQRALYLKRIPSMILFHPNADNETINILQEDLVNITVALGANRTFAEEEVQQLFSFISDLYHLDVISNSSIYYSTKFRKSDDIMALFPVKEYIENMVLPFSKIGNDTYVYWADSIDELRILMAFTQKRVQANYIIWSVISKSIESLNKDIRGKYEKLLADGGFESYIRKYSSRTEECIKVTSESMPVSLSALYIRNHFDRNLKNDTIRILENIREQIVKNLDGSTRLNQQMKDMFRRKIEKTTTFVVDSSDFFNDTEVENIDKDLNIPFSNDYLHNNINLMRYMMEKTFTKLQKPIEKFDTSDSSWDYLKNKREWKKFDMPTFHLYDLSWNAWYMDEFNAAFIPASYLQGIMNKIGNPEYIKYGATGFTLGHEFYHALDNLNRISNQDSENITWDNFSEEIFHRQDECFINQYNNFSVEVTKLNGQKLLQENIADHGGIKAVYQAYSNLASKKDEPELFLPNLSYTPKKLFWISMVNNFCFKEKYPNSYNTEDGHTPLTLRFLGALSNMPEFAKDFNCSVGSRMNPSNKCFV